MLHRTAEPQAKAPLEGLWAHSYGSLGVVPQTGKKVHIIQRKTSQVREEPFSVKPWSNKGQRQGQHTSVLREAKPDQAVQSWAGQMLLWLAGQDSSTPLRAGVTSQNMQTHLEWTHMPVLALKCCRAIGIGSYTHPNIQQVKNTWFLISCAPPVITELAGKAKKLHMWPFHWAAVADANRDIQGERTHLTLLL